MLETTIAAQKKKSYCAKGQNVYNMQNEEEPEPSSSGIGTSIIIVGCVAGFVFTVIYFVCWIRTEKKDDDDEQANETGTRGSGESRRQEEMDSSNNEENEESDPPEPPRKFVHAWAPKERQPGDPIYDWTIIQGTIALATLLWIGATIVLIMSQIEKADLDGASRSDFRFLGESACQIESSFSYTYYEVRVNALNSLCIEQWEYNVRVREENTYFVSQPLSSESCRFSCDECLRFDRLGGPDFFIGSDSSLGGSEISNQTFSDCFAPTIPVEDLSGFFDCGVQRDANGTCYLLEDIDEALEKEEESINFGQIAAYSGYIGGALLFILVWFFIRRNKVVRERELAALEKEDALEVADAEGEAKLEDDCGVQKNTENGGEKDVDEEEEDKEKD